MAVRKFTVNIPIKIVDENPVLLPGNLDCKTE